jgi:hypothetical protein
MTSLKPHRDQVAKPETGLEQKRLKQCDAFSRAQQTRWDTDDDDIARQAQLHLREFQLVDPTIIHTGWGHSLAQVLRSSQSGGPPGLEIRARTRPGVPDLERGNHLRTNLFPPSHLVCHIRPCLRLIQLVTVNTDVFGLDQRQTPVGTTRRSHTRCVFSTHLALRRRRLRRV